jgi:magnesium-transporting ATPase (P-type)
LFEENDEKIKDFVEKFVILIIIIENEIVGVWKERNEEYEIEEMKEYENEMGKVVRGEKYGVKKISEKEIVNGDVVEV